MRQYKLFLLIATLFVCTILVGCGTDIPSLRLKGEENADAETAEEDFKEEMTEAEITEPDNIPDLTQVKSICELATLKCYYHNVAKSTKEAGTGFSHIGEKDRKFWIEYTGNVEISYKAELIKMQQDGNKIIITLPEPHIDCTVDQDSWTEDSYVIENDQWIQKNPITAEDQTKAISQSKEDMENDVRNNSTLLATAKMQAQTLIENYINQIGNVTDVDYEVIWVEESLSEE